MRFDSKIVQAIRTIDLLIYRVSYVFVSFRNQWTKLLIIHNAELNLIS